MSPPGTGPVESENQGLPLVRREASQRQFQPFCFSCFIQTIFHSRSIIGCFFLTIRLDESRFLPLLLFQVVPDSVDGNRIQPCEKRALTIIAMKVPEGPYKGLLGQVIGILKAACHSVCQLENGIFVSIDQKGIGIGITLQDTLDNVFRLPLVHPSLPVRETELLPCAVRTRLPAFFIPEPDSCRPGSHKRIPLVNH